MFITVSDYKQKQQTFSALSFLFVHKAEIISFLVYWGLYSAFYSIYSYDHKIHQYLHISVTILLFSKIKSHFDPQAQKCGCIFLEKKFKPKFLCKSVLEAFGHVFTFSSTLHMFLNWKWESISVHLPFILFFTKWKNKKLKVNFFDCWMKEKSQSNAYF